MKLGLRGPKEDPKGRTLKLREFMTPFSYAASCDLMFGKPPDIDPLGNTVLGVCALAAPAHRTRWEDLAREVNLRVQAEDVIREYQNFGWDPNDPSTDNGCYGLDVMKRWRNPGLFGGKSKIHAFAHVNYLDREELAMATFLTGGVFLSLNLPKQVTTGRIFDEDLWDAANEDGGSEGGHMVWRYGDTVNTWGKQVVVSPAFIQRYCYEAFAVITEEAILKTTGRSYAGLDMPRMMEALQRVTA